MTNNTQEFFTLIFLVVLSLHPSFKTNYRYIAPIPVAARYKEWVCGRSLAGIVGSNPAGVWMSASCECCVLSGVVLCDELITRPTECGASLCVI
jgi:hypothetical protein